MIARLRRDFAALLTSGAQLALVTVGVAVNRPVGWVVVLTLVASLSLVAWTAAFRRWRAIADTPTSPVKAAAQGYAELAGTAENHPGLSVFAPFSQRPCCWCRYRAERRGNDRSGWETVSEGETIETFLLRDATGKCIVDPEGAEVLTHHRRSWLRDGHRYTEWTLDENDPIYALGEFITLGSAHQALDPMRDTGELLAEWKRDRGHLLARFDLDRNGEIDLREWGLARAAARREVERAHAELRLSPGVDLLRKPADGRLYLLSNVEPRRLSRRYRAWAWAHLGIFVAATAGAAAAAGL